MALSILINYLYSDNFYNCESENIHTHTKEGYWKFQGGWGGTSMKKAEISEGWVGSDEKPSMGKGYGYVLRNNSLKENSIAYLIASSKRWAI